jgi:hypothetical protein
MREKRENKRRERREKSEPLLIIQSNVEFRARVTRDNSKFEESSSFPRGNEPDYTHKFTKLSAEKCSNEENVPQTFK